jgi:putative lipoic acid-binding regulatory protein
MSEEKPSLEELIEFPATFTFRAVADTSPDIIDLCEQAVSNALGRKVMQTASNPSKNGRFCSVRVTATVISADEIRAAYAAIHALDGIRMML